MMKKPFMLKPKKEKKGKGVVFSKKELEQKAIEGAKKAVSEYRRVFERLAEYDRA